MAPKVRTVEEVAARIAVGQHGVATRAQLLRAGVSADEIRHRLTAGAWITVHRGVYRVGHRAPNVHATYMAAVLAGGNGALLSGRAAAHLLGLTKRPPSLPEVIARTERRIEGVRTVRTRREVLGTLWLGIPVTTPAETVVDLAASLADDELARACHEAQIRHHLRSAHVEAVLARRPNATGAAKVKAVVTGETPVTVSALERRFFSLIDAAGLPRPIMNRKAGSKHVDARWPEHKLTVELDSYRFHNSRYSWEQDRKREREAHARGDTFRRYTHRDVFDDPGPMLAELALLLSGA